MFVTFEGLSGSGKSTQVELLRRRLESDGVDVVATREPGGTALGEEIRELLLHREGEVAPWAEAALFAASRAQHVEEVIRPALGRGATVICDRYVDSSLAYQGIARGLGLDEVLEVNLRAVRGLLPERTFLLLVDPEEGARRMGRPDRIGAEGIEFLRRVEAAFEELAARFPERIVAVEGGGPAEEVAERIHGELRRADRAG